MIGRLPDDWYYIHQTMVVQMTWVWTFSTMIAIIRACACWALFVVTLTNTVHLIYIYIYKYIYIYIYIQRLHYIPSGSVTEAKHSVESPSMVDPQWNIWYWGSKWNWHTVCWSAVGCEWGTTSVYFGITYVCFIPSRLPVFAVEPQYLLQYF